MCINIRRYTYHDERVKVSVWFQCVWEVRVYIPYIRLFTRHVFSANSNLKHCIKSTRMNISRKHSKSLNLPDLQDTVSNLRECIFTTLIFSRKWMHAENTWYTVCHQFLVHRQHPWTVPVVIAIVLHSGDQGSSLSWLNPNSLKRLVKVLLPNVLQNLKITQIVVMA